MRNFRNLTLLLLFVLVACDNGGLSPRRMQISDANPVQFWVSGDTIYNDQDNCGVENACFCQPFECADNVRFQFTDTQQHAFVLRALDSSNNQLFSSPFVAKDIFDTPGTLQFSNPTFLGGTISPWANYTYDAGGGTYGSRVSFSFGAGPVARASGSASGNTWAALGQYRATKWTPGVYTISITAANNSTGGSAPTDQVLNVYGSDTPNSSGVLISSAGAASWVRGAGSTVRTFTVTILNPINYITFFFYKNGPQAGYVMDFSISAISITSSPAYIYTKTIYDQSFTFSSAGLCDSQVKFQIYDTTSGSAAAISDCIDIRSTQECTKLVTYSNDKDFAGLYYTNESPDVTFYLRVPAVFFDESFPEEMNFEDLSNSQTVQLFSEVKQKKLFEVGYMPYFMHKKLILVLSHNSVLIDEDYWQKQDAYQIDQGNKRYSLRKATALLTNANYIQRNVL